MNLLDKIVQTIPLTSIWTDQKEIKAQRITNLTRLEITGMLKNSATSFIVADIGKNLEWVDKANCFDFWKGEINPHVKDFPDKIILGNFPN